MIEFVNEVKVELITASASDDMVAMAAWVSNDQDSAERLDDRKGIEGLINFLYRNRHMSPFEHGLFIFKVDVPLFVAREWHRHRTMSYNEVSGRYTEMKPRFYIPVRERPLVQEGKMGNYHFVEGGDEQYALVTQAMKLSVRTSWEWYQTMLENGVAKEVARDILPLSLMTQFYVSVDPRNLMQFLSLRNDSHALYEIRQAAAQMDKIFEGTMPLTHKAFKKYKITMVEEAREEEKSIVPAIQLQGSENFLDDLGEVVSADINIQIGRQVREATDDINRKINRRTRQMRDRRLT